MLYEMTVGRETLVGPQCYNIVIVIYYMSREMMDERRIIIGIGLWAHSILILTLILIIL